LPSNLAELRLAKRTLGMWVPQRIHNYLYECKCTLAIDLVGELVEYVKECHQVAGDTKTIFVDKWICEATEKGKITPVE
jgi:hypothetical protein